MFRCGCPLGRKNQLSRHHIPKLQVQTQTSNPRTNSWDKDPFKGGEHGARAPRTSKDYQYSIMRTMHLMTSKDINWNLLAPIMAYKVIPCNANGKYVISLKRPNRPQDQNKSLGWYLVLQVYNSLDLILIMLNKFIWVTFQSLKASLSLKVSKTPNL